MEEKEKRLWLRVNKIEEEIEELDKKCKRNYDAKILKRKELLRQINKYAKYA